MSIKKKLLIYAHYYLPDTASTGQILAELAQGLLDRFDVTVICVVPSYTGEIEDKYKDKKYYFENISGVNVIRVRVPEFTKSNKISRVKNILSYFFRAMIATNKTGKIDYVMSVSQPPILGGLLGIYGKWIKKSKFIYQIQDFNPEQVLAVDYSKNKFITSFMMALDKFSCKHSDLVITVGRDLVETLKNRFKNKKVPRYVLINNWIDEKSIYPLSHDNQKVQAFREKYNLTDKFVIMYSGNLGLYYDLLNILKVIKKFDNNTKTQNGKEVVFAFVGDGSIKKEMEEYVNNQNMKNVVFIPYQDKSELIYSLNAADVHWCVNAKGIKGVSCPSKYYGLAAVAKPVLSVLESGSEIRCIIEETNSGLVCDPEDYDQIYSNIKWFIDNANSDLDVMGQRGYSYLIKNLTKEKSIKKYADEICDL